ncbi:hypothetical protein OEZ86_002132 [Tetradesmus obliquus]|nr:hypothetical protein OEZ86_002132 [Tetradesmus obliquus]
MIPLEDECIPTSLQDVTSCEAYKVVDTLIEIGHISGEHGQHAKQLYERLHSALVGAMQQEKSLLEQARQLAKEAQASEAAAQEAERKAAAFEGISIEVLREDVLREDVEAALAEASLAQERAALLGLEQDELQQQRDQLAEHLDSVAEQHAAALAPVIAGLQGEVSGLKSDLEQQRLAAAVAQQELEGARGRLAEADAELSKLQQEAKAEANRLTAVSAAPEKARRQADMAVAELQGAQGLLAAADSALLEAEAALRAAHDKERQKQLEYASLLAALERGRIMTETKDRHVDDVAHDVELAGIEREKILSDQVDLDLRMQALASELRSQHELLSNAQHDKLVALRAYKAAEVALAEAQETLPPLKIARDLTTKDKAAAEAELVAAAGQIEELKKEVDVRIAAFLKEEAIGQDKVALFNVLQQEVVLLEGELAAIKEEDRQRTRLLGDMAAQRDRAARHAASVRAKVTQAQSAAKLRARQESDLQLQVAEVARRRRDFEKLYDLVRNQRNKFVALIAAAGQASVEMGDRLKLLASEQDILAANLAAKAKLLAKARTACSASVKERDALYTELHSLGATFRAKHDKLQEQMESIEALSNLINRAEGAMVSSRKTYEAAIAARNNTGVMLIDRNDELAVLHEKAHLQEAQIAAGNLDMGLRENETRVLRLQVAELERSIHALNTAMPDLPAIDRDIAALKADLLKARQSSAVLGDALEDPSHPATASRVRLLGGRVPEKDELVAKLQSLEERLSMTQDGLGEKALVLGEVTHLTEGLRGTAAEGRATGAQLAAAANAYQGKLRSVTRRMMATISELSLYQATALNLHASKVQLQQLLATAQQRLEAGQPPTEEAEMEWAALARQQATLDDLAQQREEVAAILDQKGALQYTTAEPRPNAYIPDELGIPKPYGAFSPFKPSAPGTTMRHVRKPAPREIVI